MFRVLRWHTNSGMAEHVLFCCRYRNLIERALRARLVYGTPNMNRAVSFEYMNRQLVWNEFSVIVFPSLNWFYIIWKSIYSNQKDLKVEDLESVNRLHVGNQCGRNFVQLWINTWGNLFSLSFSSSMICRKCYFYFFLFLTRQLLKAYLAHFRRINLQALKRMSLLVPSAKQVQPLHFLPSPVNIGILLNILLSAWFSHFIAN